MYKFKTLYMSRYSIIQDIDENIPHWLCLNMCVVFLSAVFCFQCRVCYDPGTEIWGSHGPLSVSRIGACRLIIQHTGGDMEISTPSTVSGISYKVILIATICSIWPLNWIYLNILQFYPDMIRWGRTKWSYFWLRALAHPCPYCNYKW